MVLADALACIADEAHAPRGKVIRAAEIVEDFQRLRIGVERVDREIAAGGVLLPVAGKGHGGAAAVGRDIVAQGRDLDRASGQNGGDRAMGDAGRYRADAGRGAQRHHLFRMVRGGRVDVLHRQIEQRIAHRAADPAHGAMAERGNKRGKIVAPGPRGGGQHGHAVSPIGRSGHAMRWERLAIIAAVIPQMRCPSHMISI